MKRILIITGSLISLLLVFYGGYTILFPPKVVLIASAEGFVEIEKGGKWIPIREGMKIKEGTLIRTSRGKVVLQFEKGAKVLLREESALKIEKMGKEGSNLFAQEGTVEVTLPVDAPAFIIRDKRGDALKLIEGEFALNADEEGLRSAVAKKGKGLFITKDGIQKELKTDTKVIAGESPEVIEAKPQELFLEVDFPKSFTNVTQVEIRGETLPDASIDINGIIVRPERSGRFAFLLNLEEGKNEIKVTAKDLFGQEKVKTGVVYVDLTIPHLRLKSKDMWE